MTQDQFEAILRALSPLLIGLLIGWGVDSVTAGAIVTAILAILSAVWAWYAHRPTSLAQAVAKQPGVQVVVSPAAPKPLQELAADGEVPDVVPAPPNGGL